MKEKLVDILDTIGNTPLVPVKKLNPYPDVEIFAKLEYFNPGGSIKDRAALSMIEEAEKSGDLVPGKIILEATSGNTGIGLSMVAAVKGYRIRLAMSESASEERIKILTALGAEIHLTPAHMSTDGAIEYVYETARKHPDRFWLADQYNNDANWLAHYRGTGPEIFSQTGGRLDAVVATVGTTGTVMGLKRYFGEKSPGVRVVAVEPFLGHKIQGLKNMKESYRPGIFRKEELDEIIHIDDDEAFEMARSLARLEGIFAGMSSGAAMAAALKIAGTMESGRIVAVFPDGGERYLSTGLFTARKKTGIRFFNTLSRTKDEFVPVVERKVAVYTCGPAFCRPLDLSQCRRLLFTDILKRCLKKKNFEVTHVMNITDLDDLTIEAARRAGKSIAQFTGYLMEEFKKSLSILGIVFPDRMPRASEHVEDMMEIAGKLVEKGYGYAKFRSIYFDISRFRKYGSLSGIDLEKIRVGKTVDLDLYEKDNPRDFTLLKRSTLDELKKGIFYQTRWGKVRPGWHLQCATLALKHEKTPYDIHTGGVELIFPHDENTAAIAEALAERPLANYWLHSEPVLIDGRSGSSPDNEARIGLDDLVEKGISGREIRYWLLSRHYRKPIVFEESKFKAVKNTLTGLDDFTARVHAAASTVENAEIDQAAYDLKQHFQEAMADDLNIAAALAALFSFVNRVERIMASEGLSGQGRQTVLNALEGVDEILGILSLEPPPVDREIRSLVERRETARKDKNWKEADRIREELNRRGIEILDTSNGPVWKRSRDQD
ncbi:MAG TPA: cysteine synthase [Desulfobacteraceae bacterium]|nr:cysteine synthase [Desulfobacteraceae bacterium]